MGSLPGLNFSSEGYFSEAELLKNISNDPAFGSNIGIHPVNRNHMSICRESSVKIYYMRNVSQPLSTVEMQIPGREHYHTKGISGANWSPGTGKYFLACPIKTPHNSDIAKQYHTPLIFNSSNLTEPVRAWAPLKGLYENASFSHNFGASWCPWQEGVFFTTSVYRYNAPLFGNHVSSLYKVVAIDATSGAIVSEITEDLDNSRYLIECHKTRNWVVVGNARGAGDLLIYQSGEKLY